MSKAIVCSSIGNDYKNENGDRENLGNNSKSLKWDCQSIHIKLPL